MPFCSLKNEHGKIISAPHKKIIMNARYKTKENNWWGTPEKSK